MFRIIIFLIMGFIVIAPGLAYAGVDSGLAPSIVSCSFPEWLNTQGDNKPDDAVENIIIREQWENNLGVDIFYPYFKAKELESKVREKSSVSIFKIKGKAEFKNKEAKYIFKIKF